MIFDTNKEIILEDERVLLRPLGADDLPELLHYVASLPDLWRLR